MSKVRFLGEPRSFHWGHHSVKEMGPLKKRPQVTDWQWMFSGWLFDRDHPHAELGDAQVQSPQHPLAPALLVELLAVVG